MSTKTKSVLMRFVKGIIAGAVSAMGMVTIIEPTVWNDFTTIFGSLLLAGAFGALNGLLLALNKWASWQD
jgi:hypothetical protein